MKTKREVMILKTRSNLRRFHLINENKDFVDRHQLTVWANSKQNALELFSRDELVKNGTLSLDINFVIDSWE